MEIILLLIAIIITYFTIKLAVKNAIYESLEDIRGKIKEAITDGLYKINIDIKAFCLISSKV
ncbi:hypothetical protein JHL18_21565 [Clostridium sp. YIM B02505]|uniref:Uncharacterized protein n=1 Tax=Clostridium yunnanense TaxID=2800325 RepID=A0ABS1EV18_9CLOT|nr:DUF6019 family protein [Clostridium yunnanense]MBK1813214.1 hypothetical protein [Clostridium yunnanense]